MAHPLSMEDVRQVARLARLRLDDAELHAFRDDLAAVLEHVDRLQSLDVTDVEPMAYPCPITNRLRDDTPTDPMPVADLLRNAPATEGDYLAVPKVIDGEAS